MKTIADLNAALDPARAAVKGMVRRMTVTLTSKLWQVAGFKLLDGKTEAFAAEAFTGIGFFARPPASGKPEAIVIMLSGDGDAPVITAVRDEKTRAAIAGALKPDESAVFNSQVILHMTDTGEIRARTKNGVAVSLALKSDVQAVVTAHNAHTHGGVTVGTAVTSVASALSASPTGTTCLKGH